MEPHNSTARITLQQILAVGGWRQEGADFVRPCPICGSGDDGFIVGEGDNGEPRRHCRPCGGRLDWPAWRAHLEAIGVTVPGAQGGATGIGLKAVAPPAPPPFEPTGREGRMFTWQCAGPKCGPVVRCRKAHPSGDPTKKAVYWIPNLKENGLGSADFMYSPAGVVPLAPGTETVVITEGEVDADAVHALGLTVLGTCTGSGSAPSVETLAWWGLAGRKVLLWPDRAADGYKHMRLLADALAKLEPAPAVQAIDPERLTFKWTDGPGAADWIPPADVNPRAALKAARVAVDALPDPAPEIITPAVIISGALPLDTPAPAAPPAPPLRLIPAGEVVPTAVPWLWKRRAARGEITIVDGDPGSGKSLFGITVAAGLTQGRAFPDGDRTGVPPLGGRVVWFGHGGEDSIPYTVLPRFLAADGNEAGLQFTDVGNDAGLAAWALKAAEDVPDLVVVDSWAAWTAGDGGDNNSPETVRARYDALQPLRAAGAAIFLITHSRKGAPDEGNDLHRVSGSAQVTAVPRMALRVASGAVTQTKGNLGGSGPVLQFEAVGCEVDTRGGRLETVRLAWLERAPQGDTPGNTPAPPQGAGGVSTEAVLDYLMTQTEPVAMNRIREAVGCAGKAAHGRLKAIVWSAIAAGKITGIPNGVTSRNNRKFTGYVSTPGGQRVEGVTKGNALPVDNGQSVPPRRGTLPVVTVPCPLSLPVVLPIVPEAQTFDTGGAFTAATPVTPAEDTTMRQTDTPTPAHAPGNPRLVGQARAMRSGPSSRRTWTPADRSRRPRRSRASRPYSGCLPTSSWRPPCPPRNGRSTGYVLRLGNPVKQRGYPRYRE